jgi:PhoPQ-activated pathogenicity-related protein
MSLMPYSQSNEMLTQLAMSKLMRDPSEESKTMSLVVLIATSTTETLSQSEVRVTEALSRKTEIISGLKISDQLKEQLLAQAVASSNSFSSLLLKIGEASANLVR